MSHSINTSIIVVMAHGIHPVELETHTKADKYYKESHLHLHSHDFLVTLH